MRPGLHVPAVDADTVVLVEGDSDRVAVETLAGLRGVDLVARRTVVLAMGGVTNIGHHLRALAPDQRVLGLCDAGETAIVLRALERAARSPAGADDRIAALALAGFRTCVADLEDELIRALGTDGTEQVLERAGGLRAFRTLQHQPAQQGRTAAQQLRRWFGSGATRKIRFAALMVEAIEDAGTIGRAAVPAPLERLVADL